MRTDTIFFQLIIVIMLLNPQTIFSSILLQEENNSVSLADKLTLELINNPEGENVPFYINRLIELAPAVGRKKISTVFRDAAAGLKSESGKSGIHGQILKYSTDELEGTDSGSNENFTILKRWNISGPWKKYGRPDYEYKFNPELVYKIEDIEKGRTLSAEENGRLFPFGLNHSEGKTFYATCSFFSTGTVILWITADSEYKLIINGKEIHTINSEGRQVIHAVKLTGARGYTVQIKMHNPGRGTHPFIRGMITDEHYNRIELKYSSVFYTYNYESEKIFNSEESVESLSLEASVLTDKMREYIFSGDYAQGYKLGLTIIDKYPLYFPAYKVFIPLLDVMNREMEFHQIMEKYLKLFPSSDFHYRWLGDFYMNRDRDKFTALVSSMPVRYFSNDALKSYIYLLCGEKKYSEALLLCKTLKSDPFFSRIIPEILRVSGDSNAWRKSLIDSAAVTDNDGLYYSLGLAEMQLGLDPVMYWSKGFSVEDNPGLMMGISNIYENGIIQATDFYTGEYTDLHPEFGWNGKKRKLSIHVFKSGRVVLDGEDIIPSGEKIRKEKYSEGGIEFSSGEIKTDIPSISGINVLYVLTAKDGLPTAVDFGSARSDKSRLFVKYKSNGKEEFSVIKYSAEYRSRGEDVFSFIKHLVLKSDDENVSWLEYEVICHGNFTPDILYNGKPLSPGRYNDGIIRFESKERLSKNNLKSAVLDIHRFPDDKTFVKWYSGVIKYTEKSAAGVSVVPSKNESLESVIKNLHFNIITTISKRGVINFSPGKMENIIKRGEGTVEERTHLARGILESRGIKSFIAFSKNSLGLIDKILLYVPENRDRGYWLNFYGEGISDKIESGSDAIVITGEGYNTIPVNPETYIR